MKAIVEKLETLRREPSNNAKIVLLKDYLEDETFRIVVEMALDETMHYNVSQLMGNVPRKTEPDFDMLIDYLYFLSQKQGANIAEKSELASFAVDNDWETVITRIIKKDLKCKVGAKLVNKAVPGSIHIMPYMRCSTSTKIGGIEWPAYTQVKEDGLFANIFVGSTRHIKYLSRSGNEFIFPEPSLTSEICMHYPIFTESMVCMGEFRVKIDGKWLPRQTGNGIVNKALKKNQTMSAGESLHIHFICWDIVTEKEFWEGESKTPYKDRLANLDFFGGMNRNHLSETRVAHNLEESQNWALRLLSGGEEGVIIKNFKAPWKHHTSTQQIKLKAGDLGLDNERECELRVIDFYYGKKGTKFEHCLGGLMCESEDGLLQTNVGGGYLDKDRGFLGFDDNFNARVIDNFEDWVHIKYIDKIITARFNEVIKAKTSKKHSLFSARYIEVREDKNVADTLAYIQELL